MTTFRQRLWRYLTYAWMLEEPPEELFGAHAARAANRERLRRWMPHYLRVHLVLAAASMALLWGLLDAAPLWSQCAAALLCGVELSMLAACLATLAAVRVLPQRLRSRAN